MQRPTLSQLDRVRRAFERADEESESQVVIEDEPEFEVPQYGFLRIRPMDDQPDALFIRHVEAAIREAEARVEEADLRRHAEYAELMRRTESQEDADDIERRHLFEEFEALAANRDEMARIRREMRRPDPVRRRVPIYRNDRVLPRTPSPELGDDFTADDMVYQTPYDF